MDLDDLKSRLESLMADVDYSRERTSYAAGDASSAEEYISGVEEAVSNARSSADNASGHASDAEERLDTMHSELDDLICELDDLNTGEASELQRAAEEVLHYAGLWRPDPGVEDTFERLRELRDRLRNNLGDADAFAPALCPECGLNLMLLQEQIRWGEIYICPTCESPLSISQPVEV